MTATPSRPRRIAAVLGLAGLAAALVSAILYGPGLWLRLVALIQVQQADFTRQLAAAVRALRDGEAGALGVLAGIGFVYGVVHAAGPGHGKAVIAAYALGSGSRPVRTVALSFLAAALQSAVALALVGGVWLLVAGGARAATAATERVLEPLSHGAIAAVGLYLAVGGVRRLRRPRNDGDDHHACGCGHCHDHAPEMPGKGDDGWRRPILLASAVALRPCSGAILVLMFAFSLGQWWGGMAAVAAMGLGTGLTVAALALGAQSLRWPVSSGLRAAGLPPHVLSGTLALVAGLVIALLGLFLLHATLTAPAHPLGIAP